MKAFRRCVLAGFLGLITLSLYASQVSPKANVDYTILDVPQRANTDNKVEVIEFFGYFCGHCHTLDIPLSNWAKKNSHRIAFKRVAIGFNEGTRLHQRIFYTLTAMGKLTDQRHQKIFKAVQEDHIRLRNESQVFDFVASLGVDRNKFSEVYQSFSVQAFMKNAESMQELYKIDGVPMIVIDGKYVTSLAMVAQGNNLNSDEKIYAATFKVMDYLVEQAHKKTGMAK